jgi:hypothetical protein
VETSSSKSIKTRRGKLAVAVDVFWREADAMHSLLVERADALASCPEASVMEAELDRITSAIEAYEAKRWPGMKAAGRKG